MSISSKEFLKEAGAIDDGTVKVTPEMIEAGRAVYWRARFTASEEDWDEVIAAIYRAMVKVGAR